jgi:hypothetical protein
MNNILLQDNTYTRTITYLYEYTYAQPTITITSERLSQLDIEIHEVDHQERLTVDSDVTSH